MVEAPDDRPPMVRGMQWATQVTTISLEMVLPALVGLWLDRKLGTVMVFLILGAALGMTLGMIHLVHLVDPQDEQKKNETSAEDDETTNRPPRRQ